MLPLDLVEDILSRVSLKSLARFRSTCKEWQSLIADEIFLKKHWSKHDGEQEQFILLSHCHYKISSVVVQANNNPPLASHDLTLRKSSTNFMLTVHKIVHCEGVLLYVMQNRLIVWNPLLKQARWIKCSSHFNPSDNAYALGYISQSSSSSSYCRDYRIVRFRCPRNANNEPPRVEVYQLSSTVWKVIYISFDGWFLKETISTVTLRGTPYWIGLREDKDDCNGFIQTFDFSKEIFEPLDDDDLPFNPLALGIFKGDWLTAMEECHKTRKINIWLRNHWASSWSRLMTVIVPQQLPVDEFDRLMFHSSYYFIDKNGNLSYLVAQEKILLLAFTLSGRMSFRKLNLAQW